MVSGRKKFDIFSRLDTIHKRVRQSDRRTDTGRQQRPLRVRIASRGKKKTKSDVYNHLQPNPNPSARSCKFLYESSRFIIVAEGNVIGKREYPALARRASEQQRSLPELTAFKELISAPRSV